MGAFGRILDGFLLKSTVLTAGVYMMYLHQRNYFPNFAKVTGPAAYFVTTCGLYAVLLHFLEGSDESKTADKREKLNPEEQHMEQDNSFASLEEPVASHVKKSLQEEAVKMKVRDERRQNWIEESKILEQRMKYYESLEESRKLEQERKSRERRLLKLVQQREKLGRIEDEEQELGQSVKSHEAKELGSEHKLQPRQKGRNFPDGLQQGEQTGLTMNERLKRERQQEKARKDSKPHENKRSRYPKKKRENEVMQEDNELPGEIFPMEL